MCGIAGIYRYTDADAPVDEAELLRIREHMQARGPDGAGLWLEDKRQVGLAHRRLSIIDLSERANQPMLSSDGRFVISFNGEIYNYREIKAELKALGCEFRTQSDTEVLLQLYARDGDEMVHKIRGMFAFAIWDREARSLFLARDPYGIKPLYYADNGGIFRFASQVKALVAGGAIPTELDPAGWAGFYLFGSVPEPHTIYRAINCLPAGTTLTVSRKGAGAPRPYRRLGDILARAEQEPCVDGNDLEIVREALADSIKYHMVSDVSVGMFLSGGIDSGALGGLIREHLGVGAQAITLAFKEFEGTPLDEAPLARETAARYKLPHHVQWVSEEEFRADLPQILKAMDQPTIDGVNSWFVSKAARRAGLKVALSGLGGDELFGGYPSFTEVPRLVRATSLLNRIPGFGAVLRNAVVKIWGHRRDWNPKWAGVLEYGGTYHGAYFLRRALFMPWELKGILGERLAREGLEALQPLALVRASTDGRLRNPFSMVCALESAIYMRNQLLRDVDWASMAHSLEVRVPLVDISLLKRLAHVFSRRDQPIDKSLLAGSLRDPLPTAILNRPKSGFGTPIGHWLRRAMLSDDGKESGKLPSLERHGPWSRLWAHCVAQAFRAVQD